MSSPGGSPAPLSPSRLTVITEERALKIIRPVVHNYVLQIRMANDQKRRSIIKELIKTEMNYCESLAVLDEVFYRPLDQSLNTNKPIIDTHHLSMLFGNIDQIGQTHQNGILKVMNEISPDLQTAFPPSDRYLQLASAFLELLPRMQQLYTEYLKTNEQSEAVLQKLLKNRAFKDFIGAAVFNPKAKCRSIEDFLILPLQRISGYKLLFERVLKYFKDPDSPEHSAFKQTFEAMSSLGAKLNQEKMGSKDQEKLLNISETVLRIPSFLYIMKPGRKCIGKSTLWQYDPQTDKKGQRLVAYVMTDILLIARVTKGGFLSGKKHVFMSAIPITQIRFSDSGSKRLYDRAFVLKTDIEEFYFMLSSNDKRNDLIDAIKRQKKAIKRRVRKQSLEGAAHMQAMLNELSTLYVSPTPPRSKAEALQSL